MRLVLLLCLLLACTTPKDATADQVDVAVSIPPLHSLVAAVMEGVAAPYLIIQGTQSPHAFSLKPSAARALQKAGIVFWVGPQLESALRRPIRKIATSAKIVEISSLSGIELLKLREDEHSKDHGHDHNHGHNRTAFDMHLWLAPKNAMSIVSSVVQGLSEQFPSKSAEFKKNGARTLAQLSELEAALRAKLSGAQQARVAVFHDAFQYYEQAFGLSAPLVINVNPEHRPSAARVRSIERHLKSRNITCVFAEPQFNARHLKVYTADGRRTLATIDPLGSGLKPGKDLYFQMMHSLADGITGCVQSG